MVEYYIIECDNNNGVVVKTTPVVDMNDIDQKITYLKSQFPYSRISVYRMTSELVLNIGG